MQKVLVTGNQRSGTTLLQVILSSFRGSYTHPEEKNPFNKIPKTKHKNYIVKCPQGQYIEENDRYKGDFIKGDQIKTIGDLLKENWKIIYVARDGRDVCVSKHNLNKDIYWARPWQWIYSHDNAKSYYDNPNLFFVKYEDLTTNHQHIVKKIAKFLNDVYSNYNKAYSSFENNSQVRNAVRNLRPIDQNSVGNWRNQEHKNRIKEILKSYHSDFCRVLQELGYESDDSWSTEFL